MMYNTQYYNGVVAGGTARGRHTTPYISAAANSYVNVLDVKKIFEGRVGRFARVTQTHEPLIWIYVSVDLHYYSGSFNLPMTGARIK